MTQPIARPLRVSDLMHSALGQIVAALSDRGRTDAEYDEKSNATWLLVQSFRPRDAIEVVLVGHLIAFNEIFADSAHHLLMGLTDALRPKALSSIVAMGRLALAQVAALEKRDIQPYRSAAAIEQRDAPAAGVAIPDPAPAATPTAEAPAASPPAAEPAKQPPVAAARPAAVKSVPDAADPAAELSAAIRLVEAFPKQNERSRKWLLDARAALDAERSARPAGEAPTGKIAAKSGQGPGQPSVAAPPASTSPHPTAEPSLPMAATGD